MGIPKNQNFLGSYVGKAQCLQILQTFLNPPYPRLESLFFVIGEFPTLWTELIPLGPEGSWVNPPIALLW